MSPVSPDDNSAMVHTGSECVFHKNIACLVDVGSHMRPCSCCYFLAGFAGMADTLAGFAVAAGDIHILCPAGFQIDLGIVAVVVEACFVMLHHCMWGLYFLVVFP